MNAKQAAAYRAVSYIQNGMTVGLGTGSTAYWAIHYLAERVADGLKVTTVATSESTASIAAEKGIKVSSLDSVEYLDIDIDGADEIDPQLNLIKGGGGALLREKIVAAASRKFIVIADESKLVDVLGSFPLPVEVLAFGREHTARHLQQLGCKPVLREKDGQAYITDNGHQVLDCHFNAIPDPALLDQQVNAIPGVVENGLFVRMAKKVIVGYADGSVRELA